MKKISFISLFVFILIFSGIVVSCSKDDDRGTETEKKDDDKGAETEDNDNEEDGGSIPSLTVLNYTTDGYFDGVLYYQITSNAENTAEITKCSQSVSAVKIPQHVKINETIYSITSIHSRAFKDCKELNSVIISNSIEFIGKYAFDDCINLASVVFGKNVASIGDGAFTDCPISRMEFENEESLGRLMSRTRWRKSGNTIANLRNYIDIDSFYSGSGEIPLQDNVALYIHGKEVHDIIIPNSVTAIDDFSFAGCNGLTSVMITNGVTEIGVGAFWGCNSLTSIIIPNSIKTINSFAFYNCI